MKPTLSRSLSSADTDQRLAHNLSGPASDQVLAHSLTSTSAARVAAGRKTLPTRVAKKGRK